jgi:hypothetical protein
MEDDVARRGNDAYQGLIGTAGGQRKTYLLNTEKQKTLSRAEALRRREKQKL